MQESLRPALPRGSSACPAASPLSSGGFAPAAPRSVSSGPSRSCGSLRIGVARAPLAIPPDCLAEIRGALASAIEPGG